MNQGEYIMKNKEVNSAFQEMFMAAKKRLNNRSPFDIAEKAGVIFCQETSTFKINSLGETIEVEYPSYEIDGKMHSWHDLVILQYFDMANGMPDDWQAVHFGELNDGLIRGTKFDKTAELELSRFLANKQSDQVINVCKALGGKIIDSKVDLCVVFEFLPYYHVTLNIWFADDEFEASGKMLVNKSADNYLSLEGSVGVGEIMLKRILEKYKELYDMTSGGERK